MVTLVTVPEISEGALGGGCSDETPSGSVWGGGVVAQSEDVESRSLERLFVHQSSCSFLPREANEEQ